MQVHLGTKGPWVHGTTVVAENVLLSGNVTLGPHVSILHGAQIIAEGKPIHIGAYTTVMQNAVIRSTPRHALKIGKHCVVGPQTHLVGCEIADEVFVATGASVFHGAKIGKGSEVRIGAVVHVKTVLKEGTIVPIHWVAVGRPAKLFAPQDHEAIWEIQKTLNFPWEAYGLKRSEVSMPKIAKRLSARSKKLIG